jgi:hypothetical protein
MAGFNQPLQRVPASGGAVSAATAQAKGEFAQRFPWFLPDGRHFLYASQANNSDHVTIRTGSLDSAETQVLLEANSQAAYAEGHILYLRDSTLMAQPFDAGRRATTGDAVPVAEKVARIYASNSALGSFAVSAGGVLAYAGGDWAGVSMTWVDRAGQRVSPPFDPGFLVSFNLSPDRRRAAAGVLTSGNADIWIYDMSRSGLRSRFTFHPASERNAIWSPDGRTIVFDSNPKGRFDLYRKDADGAGAEELLFADQENKTPTSWSPDGKCLLYETGGPSTIWVLPLAPETAGGPLKPHPWLQTGFSTQNGRFSPDGKWVSYQSNESGRMEVYVASFPGAGGKRQVSTAGGTSARWRSDGKEIFYVAPDDKLTAVEVTIRGAAVEFGPPHPLFGPIVRTGISAYYDLSSDGRRILTLVPSAGDGGSGETINLVQNWVGGVKR